MPSTKPTHDPRTGLEYHRPYPAAAALAAEGRMPDGRYLPSDKQVRFVTALQRKLGFRRAEIENLCVAEFGAPYASLDKTQVSGLIDRLKALLETSVAAGGIEASCVETPED